MEITKQIRSTCPLCGKNINFIVDEKIIKNTDNFPVAVTFEHCDRMLIIYLDANFQVRGINSAFKVNVDKNYHSIDESLLI